MAKKIKWVSILNALSLGRALEHRGRERKGDSLACY